MSLCPKLSILHAYEFEEKVEIIKIARRRTSLTRDNLNFYLFKVELRSVVIWFLLSLCKHASILWNSFIII